MKQNSRLTFASIFSSNKLPQFKTYLYFYKFKYPIFQYRIFTKPWLISGKIKKTSVFYENPAFSLHLSLIGNSTRARDEIKHFGALTGYVCDDLNGTMCDIELIEATTVSLVYLGIFSQEHSSVISDYHYFFRHFCQVIFFFSVYFMTKNTTVQKYSRQKLNYRFRCHKSCHIIS